MLIGEGRKLMTPSKDRNGQHRHLIHLRVHTSAEGKYPSQVGMALVPLYGYLLGTGFLQILGQHGGVRQTLCSNRDVLFSGCTALV